MTSTLVYILAAILMFGVLIALHELGHFTAAKLCGVRVNEFSIGMGPEIWSHEGEETRYSLRLLPIGGYCAMEGEDEDTGDERAFVRQSSWKKFLILIGGPFMNMVTGFVLLLVLFSGAELFLVPELAGSAPEFPQETGQVICEGDRILSIQGEKVYVYSDINLLLTLNRGKPLDMVVLRDGEEVELRDLPFTTYSDAEGKPYEGYGLTISRTATEEATLFNQLKYSWLNTVDFVRSVRLSLQMLFSGQAGVKDISGPVGIVSTITQVGESSETVRAGVENMLFFAALIAVNLGVMNLLPIPALDGGRIFFLLIDAVAMALFHKPVPEKYQSAINTAGFVLLMGLMLLVTFQDVFKLFR